MGNTTSSSTDLTLSSVKMIIVVVQVFLTHLITLQLVFLFHIR